MGPHLAGHLFLSFGALRPAITPCPWGRKAGLTTRYADGCCCHPPIVVYSSAGCVGHSYSAHSLPMTVQCGERPRCPAQAWCLAYSWGLDPFGPVSLLTIPPAVTT